jgi:hypothetical protein
VVCGMRINDTEIDRPLVALRLVLGDAAWKSCKSRPMNYVGGRTTLPMSFCVLQSSSGCATTPSVWTL